MLRTAAITIALQLAFVPTLPVAPGTGLDFGLSTSRGAPTIITPLDHSGDYLIQGPGGAGLLVPIPDSGGTMFYINPNEPLPNALPKFQLPE